MRLASWAGVPALGFAFATGFVANELVHRHGFPAAVPVVVSAGEELSEAPPVRMLPPTPVEEIDLTCQSFAVGPQSTEPPLAGESASHFRTVSFELPAGSPEDAPLERMPYITDDAADAPATLPPLGDVPPLVPTPGDDNPLFKAVKVYFGITDDAHQRMNALINQSEDLRQAGADWRRIWMNEQPSTTGKPQATVPPAQPKQPDVSDKVPLGTPPVSEHPSTVTPNKP